MNIHPTAVVDPGAEIEDDVKIGPYTIIESNVKIGKGCVIASGALVASGARLASGVRVFHGAVVGTIPQDLKFGGEDSTAEIGENTTIREFCTVNRGTVHSGKTAVGANCLLMAYTHVAHDCYLGENVILANAVNMAGHVHIGDYTIIGGMVAIHQFVQIGVHSMVGGMFRVARDIPPYCLAGGWPIKYEGLNLVGLRRRNFTPDIIDAIKEAYRLIYQSDILRKDALAQLEEQTSIPEINTIVQFFKRSQRGVI